MNYSPKHTDNTVRALYLGLFALALITILFGGEGARGITFTCVSLVSIVSGLYLLMRFELTTYSYVMNAKENDFEFFVNKAVGKRGNYVCFYMVSDIVRFEKYSSEVRDTLKKDYQRISFYNYTHNLFKEEKSVIVFKNSEHYDAVIIEADQAYSEYIKNAIELTKQAKSQESKIDLDDDEMINIE
ncbi:MAG: hypothetical protein J6A96_06215 [Clostridia bacterium]|nr:hypothetical protein [Clostridia bacterium]